MKKIKHEDVIYFSGNVKSQIHTSPKPLIKEQANQKGENKLGRKAKDDRDSKKRQRIQTMVKKLNSLKGI